MAQGRAKGVLVDLDTTLDERDRPFDAWARTSVRARLGVPEGVEPERTLAAKLPWDAGGSEPNDAVVRRPRAGHSLLPGGR